MRGEGAEAADEAGSKTWGRSTSFGGGAWATSSRLSNATIDCFSTIQRYWFRFEGAEPLLVCKRWNGAISLERSSPSTLTEANFKISKISFNSSDLRPVEHSPAQNFIVTVVCCLFVPAPSLQIPRPPRASPSHLSLSMEQRSAAYRRADQSNKRLFEIIDHTGCSPKDLVRPCSALRPL